MKDERGTNRSSLRKAECFARTLQLAFGLICVLWSSVALQSFWAIAPAREMTARIVANERFKRSVLVSARVELEAWQSLSVHNASLERAKALMGLSSFEIDSTPEAEHEFDASRAGVRAALRLNPMDSYLWLRLYSSAMLHSGVGNVNIRLLRQSYQTGPLESWIALGRNRMALAAFPMLDDEMQDNVLSEFAHLVDSGFIDAAAASVTGAGWAYRGSLMDRLRRVDLIEREALARRLARDGIPITVPEIGIDERPWRQ
ncbi:hypothetical protein [Bradyrhizobium ottawaense]|uniref:hypothetical protein n=1 Tax=Bradyrhizobium ottawaense TaxID=931866 RepID=UPI001BAADCE9|nr:hypothetical protein [Bradyrhizobium ottawaense]MBR1329076.1 hypothetical protein [Bradyrhizobium ottawaense]